jgi:hypothetical protein
MSPLLWIAAFGAWVGVTVLWDLAMVATLRFFDIKLPFAFSIHFYPGRERELLAALKGRNKSTRKNHAGQEFNHERGYSHVASECSPHHDGNEAQDAIRVRMKQIIPEYAYTPADPWAESSTSMMLPVSVASAD